MPTIAAEGCGLRAINRIFCCLALVAIAALSSSCGGNGASAAGGAPPSTGGGKGGGRRGGGGDVPVTVATAASRDVPVEVQVIGNVEAYTTITVKAQVGGELTAVRFREGDFV